MTSTDWLKPELFVQVLKQIEPKYERILQFNCCPAMKPGENYATLLLRIDIDIELQDEQNKQISFMLKNPLENSVLNDYSESHDIFSIEKQMYFDIVPELEEMYKAVGAEVSFMPRCYDLNVNEKHILMENMCPKGYKNADRIKGLDTQHLECAIEKIAQWHAATAVRVENKGNYSEQMTFSATIDLLMSLVNVMKDSYIECLQQNEKFEELYEKTEKYYQQIFEILKQECIINTEEFNVLCHGDFWTNNVLFQYDEQEKLLGCLLVDYQIPRYGSPANDLLQIIMTCGKTELKVSNFDYFIKFYHGNLIKYLKLLKYTKPLPKLRDIHITLLKNTFSGEWRFFRFVRMFANSLIAANLCCTLWAAATMMESSACSRIDNFTGSSDEAVEFRRKMFNNPIFQKHLEIVGPWLINKGYLELNSE